MHHPDQIEGGGKGSARGGQLATHPWSGHGCPPPIDGSIPPELAAKKTISGFRRLKNLILRCELHGRGLMGDAENRKEFQVLWDHPCLLAPVANACNPPQTPYRAGRRTQL